MMAKRYNEDGVRLTDCCGSMSTYSDGTLCCKRCWREVGFGEGDGNEEQTPPIVTLKSLKVAEHLSQETTAFTATVYVDGRLAGHATNEGQGGPNCVCWADKAAEQRVLAHIGSLPEQTCELGGAETFTLKPDVDSFLGDLVEQARKQKWVKRQTTKGLVFRLADDPEGTYRTVKWRSKPTPDQRDKARAELTGEHGAKICEMHG
jgi:hypothetical protein